MMADHYGAPADPSDPTVHVVEVPRGATARSLAPALEAAGVVDSADDFVTWVRLTKEGGCIKAGKHQVRPDMSAPQLIEALCGVPLADDIPFTVVEGWRIREIDAALAAAGLAQPGEYATAVADPLGFEAGFPLPKDGLEGYLFPETYMVDPDRFTVKGFVQRQLDTLTERFIEPNAEAIQARGLAEVIIMASMLEREEPTPANRPLVAGILWKRLDSGWNLGVDATSRYTLDEWNDRRAFLKQLRDPNDPYNTRLRGGLPPTAIGNPGLTALEAAVAPTDSEYWYYLHDSQQTLHPARDAAGHEANRRTYDVY
ncbi:MAG: endolytic transglycosylase MltG [Alphaproteobacteria bacterium]|nr:endolytic transglycosylase MltG [Alphaproteobacteria bacterium]